MLALVLLFAALVYAGPSSADDVPRWLVDAAATAAPRDTARAEILLFEEQVKVSAAGKVVTTERRAIRILRGDGSGLAIAVVPYDAGSDRVSDLTAWIRRPGGDWRVVPASREVDVARVDESVYSELRSRTLSAREEVVPGTVFGYEWTRESRGVFSQFHWSFQTDLPCRLSRFTLEPPKGWGATGMLFHHPPVEPRVEGGRYTWELRDLEAIGDEAARPPITSLAARLNAGCFPPAETRESELAHFANWAEVASWLDRLTEPMYAASAEVSARALEVTRGARSQLDTVRSVAHYVQGVRYASIPLALSRGGGMRPTPAATTLTRGYGDCKDKANLMRSMLAVLGIESRLVAIYSGDPGYVEDRWPSPSMFNHCIIAIRLRNRDRLASTVDDPALGSLTLFDPTHPYLALGDLPEAVQGGLALVIATETNGPLRVPRLTGNSSLERRVSLNVLENGGIAGRLDDRAHGEMAAPIRRLAAERGIPERRAAFERWLSQSAGTTRIGALEAFCDSLTNQSVAHVEFELTSHGHLLNQRLLMFRPFLVPSAESAVLGIGEPRRYAIALATRALRETVVVRLPAGFTVDELPDPITLDTAFGRYVSTVGRSGTDLVLTRRLDVRGDRLPSSQSPMVRDFYQAIRRFEDTPVVLARE